MKWTLEPSALLRVGLAWWPASGAIIFLVAHRFMVSLEAPLQDSEHGESPATFFSLESLRWVTSPTAKAAFIALLVIFGISLFLVATFLLKRLERAIDDSEMGVTIKNIGAFSAQWSFLYTACFAIVGAVIVALDPSLINVWDLLFLMVVLAVTYIATNMHLYYRLPVDAWAACPQHEFERLKLELDELRWYMKTFLWLIVTIVVGQVFVALQLRYEPFYEAPAALERHERTALHAMMTVNALQVVFVIASIWALILGRLLRRTEEVKFEIQKLEP